MLGKLLLEKISLVGARVINHPKTGFNAALTAAVSSIGTVHGLTLVLINRFNLPYQFPIQASTLALGSALLVGGGASFLPALRASQIDPVQALRSK